jgi:hypothetical protein
VGNKAIATEDGAAARAPCAGSDHFVICILPSGQGSRWSLGENLHADHRKADIPNREVAFELEKASNLGTGLMKDLFLRAILGAVALASCSAWGQMHKVAKPEQVVRAIGVYEWTGDMVKPTASRLIPVSIFIEGKLEDAGVYVARPVPFALLSGNVYELQAAGIDRGLLDLAYARHVQTPDGTFDDGWFGYGSVKPLAAPKRSVALRPSKTLPVLVASKGSSTDSSRPQLQTKTSGDATSAGSDQSKSASKPQTSTGAGTSSASTDDPDRPTMKRHQGSEDTTTSSGSTTTDTASTKSTSSTTTDTASTKSTGSTQSDDPDRPTLKRHEGSEDTTTASSGSTTDTASTKSTGSTPADDPDRPTMKRRSDNSTDTTASTAGTGNTPADDPDRPTLKRHSPEDAKKAKNGQNDVAMATGMGSLNDDPDRPNLHHGKPTSAMTETELPKLVGLPPDLHQMVAVSDAVNRDPHEFARDWQDAAEHATVLQTMQAMARAQLAAYSKAPAPAPAPVVKKTSATRSRHTASPAVAAPEPLLEEQLKAYTLSYGGAATYVYMAHTAGTGAKLRYVTIVAQADGLGQLKPAIQNVTDAAHLDRTPRMKFVDVVDAEASNRASLLFELRGQSARQFGLYRVIAARSEQTFLTGTTQ